MSNILQPNRVPSAVGLHKTPCYGYVPLKHASLFSGIGGFDLAAEWMGWHNVFQVEKDKWCSKVLAKNFPITKRYYDIKEFNAKQYYGTIDVISGGFPCQPFSRAGKQGGKEDDRYLWPEMLRIIREVEPPIIVGENVPGIIELAIKDVLSDLENEGYNCQTFIIPACAVGAAHRRDRVWIIANSEHRWIRRREQQQKSQQETNINDTNTNSKRLQGSQESGYISGNATKWANEQFAGLPTGDLWRYTTKPGICRGTNGIPKRLDRVKGLGNAICPQVAYQIFKALESVHRHCP